MVNHLFFISCLFLVNTFLVPHVILAVSLVQVNIGVILDLSSVAGKMSMTSINLAVSDFHSKNVIRSANLVLHVRDSKGDIVTATAAALDLLNSVKVHLIIGPLHSHEAPYIAALATTAHIPVLSFSASDTSFSPSPFPFFIKTAPSDATQSQAIANLISTIRTNGVVLIYEDSHQYAELISSTVKELGDSKIHRIPISSTINDEHIYDNLVSVKGLKRHAFLVHSSVHLASRIFDAAKVVGMLSDDYVWITTEFITSFLESTVDSSLFGSMHGVLGVKAHIRPSKKVHQFEQRLRSEFVKENINHNTLQPTAYELWAYDSVWAAAIAVNRTIEANCIGDGENLLELIRNTEFEGISGRFSIGKGGLNASKDYEIVTVGEEDKRFGVWTNKKGITWRRSLRSLLTAPVTGKLRIAIPGLTDSGFSSILQVIRINGTNHLLHVGGFVIEVFEAAVALLPYSLEYEYVPFVDAQGNRLGDYNELVRQVSLKQYDAAIGDITITANRSSMVDFTQPYLDSNLLMLVPLVGKPRGNAWSFWLPWTWELWLLVAAFCFFTGFVLWVLESNTNESSNSRQSLRRHLFNIFYLSLHSPLSNSNPEITRDISKIVLTVWTFVMFTLSASYTANLTTIFTNDRVKPTVTSIQELIKNQDYVGYLQSSYDKGMLINMGFKESQLRPLASFKEYNDALTKGSKNGGVAAVIDELPYVNLFLKKYSNYTIPSIFSHKAPGFGFAFQKGLPLAQHLSRAILNLTESGTLAKIQKNRLGYYSSSEEISSTPRLNRTSFRGLFFITGSVSIGAMFIAVVLDVISKCQSPVAVRIKMYKHHSDILVLNTFEITCSSTRPSCCEFNILRNLCQFQSMKSKVILEVVFRPATCQIRKK
ncbi:glutamate receptor 2.8-like protein [Carex littledalei]|uniref:Glutamate receptor n=1 Tax=Carex littledalei TaxID=544730 RepID=A0A833R1H1_9POAL|nr:glutamate receptor 2.8-like protein [Carex littledalei]